MIKRLAIMVLVLALCMTAAVMASGPAGNVGTGIVLVKSTSYLTILPPYIINFWGIAPVGNMEVTVLIIPPKYEGQAALPYWTYCTMPDANGYFTGAFYIPVDARLGEWPVLAWQGAWMQSEGFTVVGQ